MVEELILSGADIVKCGIGPGWAKDTFLQLRETYREIIFQEVCAQLD